MVTQLDFLALAVRRLGVTTVCKNQPIISSTLYISRSIIAIESCETMLTNHTHSFVKDRLQSKLGQGGTFQVLQMKVELKPVSSYINRCCHSFFVPTFAAPIVLAIATPYHPVQRPDQPPLLSKSFTIDSLGCTRLAVVSSPSSSPVSEGLSSYPTLFRPGSWAYGDNDATLCVAILSHTSDQWGSYSRASGEMQRLTRRTTWS
jgi:hypothetical protein